MSTWTDREKLTYLISAMEFSGFRPDFKNAPLPPGRTPKACTHMVHGLKKALESDLAAMETPRASTGKNANAGGS